MCRVTPIKEGMMISDFEIKDSLRGQGFGKETLLLVLENILQKQNKDIFLHINSSNTIGYKMYSSNGFINLSRLIIRIDELKKAPSIDKTEAHDFFYINYFSAHTS
jgi:ribosomal protein S18 acetylase RimI-like enzyme